MSTIYYFAPEKFWARLIGVVTEFSRAQPISGQLIEKLDREEATRLSEFDRTHNGIRIDES